jgi:hypothetical protein
MHIKSLLSKFRSSDGQIILHNKTPFYFHHVSFLLSYNIKFVGLSSFQLIFIFQQIINTCHELSVHLPNCPWNDLFISYISPYLYVKHRERILFMPTEELTRIRRSDYLYVIGHFNRSTNYVTNQMTSTCKKFILYRSEIVQAEGTITEFHLLNTSPQ